MLALKGNASSSPISRGLLQKSKVAALSEVVEFRAGAFFVTWQWTLSPRIAGRALHELNDNELSRSAKTDTLYYTVAHLSFWMKREQSHKLVVKSCTCKQSRDGGTGRRSGLKSRCCLVLSISK